MRRSSVSQSVTRSRTVLILHVDGHDHGPYFGHEIVVEAAFHPILDEATPAAGTPHVCHDFRPHVTGDDTVRSEVQRQSAFTAGCSRKGVWYNNSPPHGSTQ